MARARIGHELAATSLSLTRRELRRAGTTAYYSALLTRRIIRISQEALPEGPGFEDQMSVLFRGSEAPRANVVKASAPVALLEQSADAARLKSQLAIQAMAWFWTRVPSSNSAPSRIPSLWWHCGSPAQL